ncbi:MAG TPA: glycoside hydrolase family 28 protein [Verrucomicrobiae bacterium]|jgi:polygalacturonase|nr:glycoside hydrolase family 28 protein [Verrucomicrobiae bacterium]
MNRLCLFVFSLVLCLFAPGLLSCAAQAKDFNVRTFGATGNGTDKDTAAFQKAIDACAAHGGGTVVVPEGHYLIGSIVLGDKTVLRLKQGANLVASSDIADYPITQVRFEGEFVAGHRALIYAKDQKDIAITGSGSITGPPLAVSRLRNPRGPVLIETVGCTNVTLDGFSTQYERLWSIHPLLCNKVTMKNLTIRSSLLNGDGIDVDSCQDVLIDRCDINTGDDAISLKSGRGQAAARMDRPTQNVTIKDCTLVSSIFAAIGIGTELSGGISNTLVEDCTLSGHQNGIFLKSRDGRGGYIKNFTGKNLTIHDSPTFLGIQLLDKGIQATDPVSGDPDQWTQLSSIHFEHIHVDNVNYLLRAKDVPENRPIDGFSLADVQGTCEHALNMANMKNVTLTGIKVTNYQGPLLTESHVQGQGVSELADPNEVGKE